MEKSILHEDICKELTSTYAKKNHDYGDSFALVRNKVPNAIMVRIYDKVNRLDSLLLNDKEIMIEDEKIEDTLLDLANYCIMEVIERRLEKVD